MQRSEGHFPLACEHCRGATEVAEGRASVLGRAASHPLLRGSRFVASRGVRDLFVCRGCSGLWWSWKDRREGWRGFRPLGPGAVSLFANDTGLARVVAWIAAEYREEVFRPIHDLVTLVVRRRPEGLREGTELLFDLLARLTPPGHETAAERLAELTRVLAVVVRRAVRGDLRLPGPRPAPPSRWRAEQIQAAAERFVEREVDGLARLPCTTDVLRRLLWERRFGLGAASPEAAVVAVRDPWPLLRILEESPFDVVADGTRRGVFAEAAFSAASTLQGEGRRPENEHAFWMPPEGWRELERLVDPVHRLAGSARRLLAAGASPSPDRAARIAMEVVLVREPLRLGARFTEAARTRLEALRAELPDSPARSDLRDILELELRGRQADAC